MFIKIRLDKDGVFQKGVFSYRTKDPCCTGYAPILLDRPKDPCLYTSYAPILLDRPKDPCCILAMPLLLYTGLRIPVVPAMPLLF